MDSIICTNQVCLILAQAHWNGMYCFPKGVGVFSYCTCRRLICVININKYIFSVYSHEVAVIGRRYRFIKDYGWFLVRCRKIIMNE